MDQSIQDTENKKPAPAGRSESEANGNKESADKEDDSANWRDADFLSFDNNTDDKQRTSGSGNENVSNNKKSPRRKSDRPISSPRGYQHASNHEVVPPPWLEGMKNFPYQRKLSRYLSEQGRGFSGRQNLKRGYSNYHQQPYRLAPLPPPPLITLHNEVVSFVNLMKPTKQELLLREKMVERVTNLALRVFGGKDKCKVQPFGSQVTGLCLPNSDIDLVIYLSDSSSKTDNTGENPSGSKEDEDYTSNSNPLRLFADAVRDEFGVRSIFEEDEEHDENQEELVYLEVIEQTKVPIIKFTVAPFNIDVDVCFDQPGGPESADLMRRFMDSMPPLRPLTFVLKYFLSSRDINKPYSGGIGSYLLQLMIVSFLQHRSRENLMARRKASEQMNLGSLLLDFFELYGLDFNYVTTGISVRADGFYFPKGAFDRKSIYWQPTKQFLLAVENPLDLKMDVGAGAFRIQTIQRIFEHAFKTLLAYVSEPWEKTHSILAMIIPPTEDMEKRMVLQKVSSIEAAISKSSGTLKQPQNDDKRRQSHDSYENGDSSRSKRGYGRRHDNSEKRRRYS